MSLLDGLRAAVGSPHVLTDADLRAPFETDWTRRFSGTSAAVARPASTAEVAEVVRVCAQHGAALVPQGGNTGLVGGGVPRAGEVVVSLTRLSGHGEVDPALGHVEVGAGVTLAALQRLAADARFDAGLDIGARDSATVGGIVACNAGGPLALRYGTARARVAGIEAVLADGTVMRRLSGLAKDNAGVDLTQLLIGSEGTLAVITRVLWKLVPRLPGRVAALVALPDIGAATDLLAALTMHAPALEACDLMMGPALDLSLRYLRRAPPLPAAPVYVIVELADRTDPTDQLAEALERAGVEDVAVADDTASRERLWALRHGVPEAIAAAGIPHKIDVGVPLRRLGDFLAALPNTVEAVAPGADLHVYGHLGDGNVHVNLLGLDPADGAVDDAVLALVLEHDGTISAEHGVGVAKAHWLPRAHPDDYLALVALKRALDPEQILNPGVGLPV
jgi:FAD/FMN-containing dehydrogenase